MKYKTLLLLASSALLASCSSPNTVEVIAGEGTITPLTTEGPRAGRYHNLYPGDKTYPLTCTENCYPEHQALACDENGEYCQFEGDNPDVTLNAGFNVQWLGHAGFIITTQAGQTVLFDPVKEQFDSPVDLAFKLTGGGYRQPGSWPSNNQLNDLDAVMYSHIHYDHFNKADIEEIGNRPRYLVPLGMADNFPEGGFNISEMAWYAQTNINDLTIHAVPAHHFSSRVLVPFIYEDHNKDLWNGWLLEQNNKTVFFAGDTGYSKHFADIAEKYGEIDICLLPIASYYHPEDGQWYRYVHTTPEDALSAARDLNCKVMIPWGYGNASWKMGDHSSHSALKRLLHMVDEMKFEIPLLILNEGETVEL